VTEGVVRTRRLDLVRATAEHLRAELRGREHFEAALGIGVPENWPPDLYDRDATEWSLRWVSANQAHLQWGLYYVVFRDRPEGPLAVGTAGYKGAPVEGMVEIGYGVLQQFRRRGIATEAADGLLRFAFAHPEVTRITAETLPDLVSSIGVMEKLGLRFIGDGSESGVIRYEITRDALARG
jgi:ribosomal-protein-alanine N-acetyltransferase